MLYGKHKFKIWSIRYLFLYDGVYGGETVASYTLNSY